MKKLISLTIIGFSTFAVANTDLSNKLDELRVPDDKVSPVVTEDKLYIVNKRYSSLVNRHELSFSGGKNMNPVSHIDNKLTSWLYRYHINSNFQVGLRYNTYYNDLTSSGKTLYKEEALLPDTDFAFKSTSAFLGINTFYGKMRLTDKSVIYFDQFVSLGYGEVDLAENGLQKMINLDAGFSFWMGKKMSLRFGLNNEFYSQRRRSGLTNVHNMMGYFELGYLFGQGTI